MGKGLEKNSSRGAILGGGERKDRILLLEYLFHTIETNKKGKQF